MVGLSGINLPNPLANKLAFLQQFGIEFGAWVGNIDAGGGKSLVPYLIIVFILTLFFKNSMEKLRLFKPNILTLFFLISILFFSIILLSTESEFLYFNF
jgi:hypothetical protein